MAVAYQLVCVHCGMTTVASSVEVARRRRIESSDVPVVRGARWGALGPTDRIRSVSLARILATRWYTDRQHGL